MEKSRGKGFELDEAIIKKFEWVASNPVRNKQKFDELFLSITWLLGTPKRLKETSDLERRREKYQEYKKRRRIIESFLGRRIAEIQRDQKRERESRDVRNKSYTRDIETAVS